MKKIDQIKHRTDETLQDQVAVIKTHLDAFKSHIDSQIGKESHEALMNAINQTVALFDDPKPSSELLEAYKAVANTMQGHARPALKVLGGVMLALGLAVGALVAFAVTGVALPFAIPAAALLPASISSAGLLIAGGYSLFAGRQHGIANDMHQLAQEHESISLKAGN